MQLENIKLNGYTLKYPLGKGGMAEVWYAENNLGKPAAIKIMLSKFIGEEQVVKRFESEAKAIVQLNHPNIRQVLDYGDFENRPFILMEYLEGEDLGKLMQKGERFSDEALRKWWGQCVSALEHTHSKGIIHRDIKPSNLFLDKSGNIKILDFGIAKVRDELSMTQTGQGLGTVMFMSPEQINDPKRVTFATDIYSLGITFAYLLKGTSPFNITKDDSSFAIQRKIVEGDLDFSGIYGDLKEVIRAATQTKYENRKLLISFNGGYSQGSYGGHEETTLVEGGKTIVDVPIKGTKIKKKTKSPWETPLLILFFCSILFVVWIVYKIGFYEYNGSDNVDVQHDGVLIEDDSKSGEEEKIMNQNFGLSKVPEMIYVEGGTFTMGCTAEQGNDCYDDEKPAHKVTVSSFSMGKYPITVAQYRYYCKETGTKMPSAPIWGWQEDHPIVGVSWNDCQSYVKWLSKVTGRSFRLPTEAEWEFAARGGVNSKGYKYAGSNDIGSVACYWENSREKTHKVGEKQGNELGLYDMSGNVWEWCSDRYGSDYYKNSPQNNPNGPSSGSRRVLRGGSWSNGAIHCRVAPRNYYISSFDMPDNGFRVALSQ